MTVEDYEAVLDVHLVGAFALTKAFIPHMKQNGHGRILFQASMTSYIGMPMVAGYSTAKAGVLGLVHALRPWVVSTLFYCVFAWRLLRNHPPLRALAQDIKALHGKAFSYPAKTVGIKDK